VDYNLIVRSYTCFEGDTTAAFVHTDVEEGKNICTEMAHGFSMQGKALKLKKTLYGVRQCPSAFWLYLTKKLTRVSWKNQHLIHVFYWQEHHVHLLHR
jgi:hypothetical protein